MDRHEGTHIALTLALHRGLYLTFIMDLHKGTHTALNLALHRGEYLAIIMAAFEGYPLPLF
jgi:hypothetical protein